MPRWIWVIIGLGLIAGGLFLIVSSPRTLPATALELYSPDLANGETMFNAAGCASCHAAPASAKCDDPKSVKRLELAGGRCFKTPYGTFVAPNISPDPENGIGGWSEIDFVNAMWLGVSPRRQHYYPAFPYASYQRMRLKDVRDLKAYIDTLPAVRSNVGDHDLALPFRFRRGLGLWKWRYLDGKRFQPAAGASDEINRGAYLVQGPGHCGECHTPRDLFGGMVGSQALSGAASPEGKGRIPSLRPKRSGLADWSRNDIAYALKTGFTPEFDVLGGTMTAVQQNMARLADADLRAIAAYLKSLPPMASNTPPAAQN